MVYGRNKLAEEVGIHGGALVRPPFLECEAAILRANLAFTREPKSFLHRGDRRFRTIRIEDRIARLSKQLPYVPGIGSYDNSSVCHAERDVA